MRKPKEKSPTGIAMSNNATKQTIRSMSLQKQNEIFAFAKQERVELSEVLSHFGRTLDDLIYERSHEEVWSAGAPRSLNDFRGPQHQIPMVSFFTGCGGIDIGFEAAGFKHLAAFEISELFCNTLRKNRPKWKIFGPPTHSGDVSKVSEIIAALESVIPINFDGIFVGGPPCQPFSVAANQRFSKTGNNFKRIGFGHAKNGNLLFDYLSIVKYFRPKCFLIENVPGLLHLDEGEQLFAASKELETSGYMMQSPVVLDAADYGIPQFRERLFVIGTRVNKSVTLPIPSKMKYGAGSVLYQAQGKGSNTETRSHKLGSVMRYVRLNYGQRDKLGRVDRLSPCRPSKTVIAGGANGGGRSHLHPEIPRTLSVRECARLQTFPDDYIFVGSTARQFTQVGNAVPPVLAAQLAISLADSVFRASEVSRG